PRHFLECDRCFVDLDKRPRINANHRGSECKTIVLIRVYSCKSVADLFVGEGVYRIQVRSAPRRIQRAENSTNDADRCRDERPCPTVFEDQSVRLMDQVAREE